jgi:diphosphoinositol-polyphosphate diphosphatase
MTIPAATFCSAGNRTYTCAATDIYKPSRPFKVMSTLSMQSSLPMSSRTGRTTARYSGTNRRLCAGIVALSTRSTKDSPGHLTHVLLTSSSRHPERFVLPKGGWESDESAEQSALREGWEEGMMVLISLMETEHGILAGVVGNLTTFLGQVIDPRPPKAVNADEKEKKHRINGISSDHPTDRIFTPRAEYLYFEVEVEALSMEYPEMNERTRKWVCIPSSNHSSHSG